MTLVDRGYAKLNLALHVRRRRADGYHDLETIFAFVEYGDDIAVEVSPILTLTIDGPLAAMVPASSDNLVRRAALALDAAAGGQGHGAAIHLTKRLPVAAGIGGGSADAAATLRLLNRLWGFDWPLDRLAEVAASIGADVAACIHSRTLRGEGRGEQLEAIRGDGLAGTPILLVNPRIELPTATVFARWDGVDRGPLAPGDPIAVAAAGRNDLEDPARDLAPVIGDVLDRLAQFHSARLVRMSGSGATCFAIFANEQACAAAALDLVAERPDWWIVETRLR